MDTNFQIANSKIAATAERWLARDGRLRVTLAQAVAQIQ